MASNPLDLFKEKCSICFDRRCDFYFPGCEDQFCTECVRRYFKEVVDNSWGLSACKIKCPVCYCVLAKEVWTKYADKKTVQRFEFFNRPFKPVARHCCACGEEVVVAGKPAQSNDEKKRVIERVLELARAVAAGKDAGLVESVQKDLAKGKHIRECYQSISQKLQTTLDRLPCCSLEMKESVATALALVISLEGDPEKWRELQLQHISSFPKMRCLKCESLLCFRCGEPTWHEGMTCKEYLQVKLSAVGNTELSETIAWTLANGKRCPNCSVLINRDDGCNKMVCLHCNFTFCWICEGAWSSLCGFYKCGQKEDEAPTSEEVTADLAKPSSGVHKRTRSSEFLPELGVPNVLLIERKLSKVEDLQQLSINLNVNSVSSAPTANPPKRRSIKDWFFFPRLFWV